MKIQKPADAARAIRTQRIAKGLTQQEVAGAVNITRQSLARIEKAHGGGAFLTYLRLFDYLDISIEAELDAIDSRVERQTVETPLSWSRVQTQSVSSKPAALSNKNISTRAIELINDTLADTECFSDFQRRVGELQSSLRQQDVDLTREQIIQIRLASVAEEANPEGARRNAGHKDEGESGKISI